MIELVIHKDEAGQRFDKFLKKYLKEASGSFLYKMLRKKNITLNGRKAAGGEQLAEGDVVKLFLSEETLEKFRGVQEVQPERKLPAEPEILYEDANQVFYNKPAGLLVQPDRSGAPSMASALTGWLLERNSIGREQLRAQRPAPVNRLDRNTTGLVLCGKTLHGLQTLSLAMKDRSLKKQYLVLVQSSNRSLRDGIYRVWAVKDGRSNQMSLSDREAPGSVLMITGVQTLKRGERLSLLKIDLITGRTHQIRAHLAYLGLPVAGDRKYGSPSLNRELAERYGLRRQLLHSYELCFPEEEGFGVLTGRSFTAPLPEDFLRVLQGEGLHFPNQ